MSIEILAGELAALSRSLDAAASEASTATLGMAAGSVAAAMPGSGSGSAMQQVAQAFDQNIRQFTDALNSDSDAATSSDADFERTDTHGDSQFAGQSWNNIDPAVNYGGK